jgi:AraC family transcriptional regulator
MAETYGDLIDKLFVLLEQYLHAPCMLNDIAEKIGLSPYHLHRVVRALTGHSLMGYLRRRRLSASLRDLLDSERRVIDIAQDYCFEYEQSFIRAFKRQFSMSPGEYRRLRPEIPLVEALSTAPSYEFLGENGIVVRPHPVMRPSCMVIGIRRAIDLEENAAFSLVSRLANEVFDLHSSGAGVPVWSRVYTGIVQYSGDSRFNWYVAGFAASKAPTESPRPPFVSVTVPSCACVSFSWISRMHPSRLHWPDIAEFYRRIFEEYMPTCSYIFPYPWHLEVVDLDACRDDYGEFRVLLPVTMPANSAEGSDGAGIGG